MYEVKLKNFFIIFIYLVVMVLMFLLLVVNWIKVNLFYVDLICCICEVSGVNFRVKRDNFNKRKVYLSFWIIFLYWVDVVLNIRLMIN